MEKFEPGQQVLIRNHDYDEWTLSFFSHYNTNGEYVCVTDTTQRCIPFNENTKKYIGTKIEPKEYFENDSEFRFGQKVRVWNDNYQPLKVGIYLRGTIGERYPHRIIEIGGGQSSWMHCELYDWDN